MKQSIFIPIPKKSKAPKRFEYHEPGTKLLLKYDRSQSSNQDRPRSQHSTKWIQTKNGYERRNL